jgi:hypothetical protein
VHGAPITLSDKGKTSAADGRARIPFAGFESGPAKVRDEPTARAERRALNYPGVDVQTWWISSKGVVHRTAPRGQSSVSSLYSVWTEDHYRFDDTGALVRIAALDKVANTSEVSTVRVRTPGEQRPVTREEAYGALAALFEAFGPLRFSLTGTGDKQVLRMIAEVKKDARSLARKLKQPELSILRDADSEVLEVLCHAYADRFQLVQKRIEGSEKQPQALAYLMGPAVECFEVLFAPATTGTRETPFTRFVVAFLRELGHTCKWRTINRHLAGWRNRRCNPPARVHRQETAARTEPVRH